MNQDLIAIGKRAQNAANKLALMNTATKNKALLQLADDLIKNKNQIIDIMKTIKKNDGKIAVWGMGLKGIALLKIVENEGIFIDELVDINPKLIGKKIKKNKKIIDYKKIIDKGITHIFIVNGVFYNENREYLEKINYLQGMVESLMTVFKFIEKAMIVAMIALLLVTLFLINNTIKITIFSRKREIEIMRLVGASNMSIKQPFVIEGLCLGFLGSVIPVLVTIYGYSVLYKHFNGQLFSPFFKLVPSEPFMYYIALILMGLGIIIGMFGSYKAVRKYLKI